MSFYSRLPSYLSVSDPSFVSFGLESVRHPPAYTQEDGVPAEYPGYNVRTTSSTSSTPRPSRPLGSVNQFGFPRPGEQFPSSDSTTSKYYFVGEAQWQEILNHGRFDDIVCGSGFCALAYIDKALELDPYRKILVLERGGFWLPTHFQNLPLPFKLLVNNSSETYPWALTSKTFRDDLRFIHGLFPFFGGRSPFWSSWSPRPPLELLRTFPESLKATAGREEFWTDCKKLLDVVKPGDLINQEYRVLQPYIENQFKNAGIEVKVDFELEVNKKEAKERGEVAQEATKKKKKIPSADYGEAADLAVGRTTRISKRVFEKFSTPGPLLKIYERQRELSLEGKGSPLTIATGVVVERFYVDPVDEYERVNVLQTSRGALCFPDDKKPNIILATGAIPACTIVLNSVEKQRDRAGSRLTGHFLTQIIARFPVPSSLKFPAKEPKYRTSSGDAESGALRGDGSRDETDTDGLDEEKDALRLAAYYLAGRSKESGLQYHADITVVHSPYPEEQQEDAMRLCPDFFASPSEAQMRGSEGHVIVACVMLGEISEGNEGCYIERDFTNSDLATNIRAQVIMSKKETELRKVMYQATDQAIRVMAGEKNEGEIEYWSASSRGDGSGGWNKKLPDQSEFQMAGIVHESSTLYMGDALLTDPRKEESSDDAETQKTKGQRKKQPSVDRNYRVYGTGNVYAAGSAIFPTAGSWNPTRIMCGFARDLASKLYRPNAFKQIFSLSLASRLANDIGPGSLRDFLQFKLEHPLPIIDHEWGLVWGPAYSQSTAWYIAYHPRLEFEDDSTYPTYVIAISSDISGFPPLRKEKGEDAGKAANQPTFAVDFDAWVDKRNEPTEVGGLVADDTKAYIDLETAKAAHRVLATPASQDSKRAGTMVLDFVKEKYQSNSARFIITGHGIGGAVSAVVALVLVSEGVVAPRDVLTYPTAAPTAGNTNFTDRFSATFPPHKSGGPGGYRGWNLNLVNTLDVVPQAWCAFWPVAPRQNLGNIRTLYGQTLGEVRAAVDGAIAWSQSSNVYYKPLPSQYFKDASRFAVPKNLDEFLQIARQQHVEAYIKEVIGYAELEKAPEHVDKLSKKIADKIQSGYSLIIDFKRAAEEKVTPTKP